MSILIKKMEKPKTCALCPFREIRYKSGYYNYEHCSALNNIFNECRLDINPYEERLSDCPLIEIPTPHGRLIDDTVRENEKYKLIRNADDVTKLLKVIWAGNYLLKYLDKEEGSSFGATTYWKDKDNDGFSGDIGYLVEGLDSMILYAKDKVNKITGGIIKDK